MLYNLVPIHKKNIIFFWSELCIKANDENSCITCNENYILHVMSDNLGVGVGYCKKASACD